MFRLDLVRSKWNGFSETSKYLELDAAIDVSLTGDMRLRIGARENLFKNIGLPWISSELVSVVHALKNPRNPLRSWDVLVPEYDTHIGLKCVADKIQVSWLEGSRRRLTAVSLPAAKVTQEIEKFNGNVCAKIKAAEPSLRWHIRRRRTSKLAGDDTFKIIRMRTVGA